MLTSKGVKPICRFQQKFQSTYLFGAFSPIDGSNLILELPFCNNETFQVFLDHLSEINKTELKIVVLDNGSFHKNQLLQVPENIVLLFLPPYSPELNPAESIWRELKRAFSNKVFKTLKDLSDFLTPLVVNLSEENVKSICSFPYVFFSDFWVSI